MINLLKSETLKLKHQKRWFILFLVSVISLLFIANHYFSLYPTYNSSQLSIFQNTRIQLQNLISQKEKQLPTISDQTIILNSIKNNKDQLTKYLNLEEALIRSDFQKANQILLSLNPSDVINNKIRQSLIEQDLPTILLGPIRVGSILGFFNYLIESYMWLIITLAAIFVGFDVINNEEPNKSIQLTFLQPYRRSHIIITKVFLRIFLTVVIIILSFVVIYFILQFNHEIGWLEQPVVYSPFSLGDNQASFADTNIMSLSDYFVLNVIYIVLNISLVINLCALINTFIKQPHIAMIALLFLLISFYINLNNRTLFNVVVYCPYFYLFKPAINYGITDPGSFFYHYRQARYVYGLLLMPMMIAINIFITLYLYKKKELR